ncbi:MAG: DUF87 domain-containing protein, partial [Clostridiales bacterium]
MNLLTTYHIEPITVNEKTLSDLHAILCQKSKKFSKSQFSFEAHSNENNTLKYYINADNEVINSFKEVLKGKFKIEKTDEDYLHKVLEKNKEFNIFTFKTNKHYLYTLKNSDVMGAIYKIINSYSVNIVIQLIVKPKIKIKKKGTQILRVCEKNDMKLANISIFYEFLLSISSEIEKYTNQRKNVPETKIIKKLSKKTLDNAFKKISERNFSVQIKLYVEGNESRHVASLVKTMFERLSDDNYLNKKRVIFFKQRALKKLENRNFQRRKSSILCESELNSLVLNFNKIKTINKDFLEGKNVFAITKENGIERKLGLRFEDLKRHVGITGLQGSGKSEFLINLFVELMKSGYSGIAIDPHEDLYRDLISRIPEERRKDIVTMDFTNTENPVPFNFLIDQNKDDKFYVENMTTEMINILKRVFENSWGNKTEEFFRMGFRTLLLTEDNPSLLKLRWLFTKVEYRRLLLSKLKNPEIYDYWINEFGNGSVEASKVTKVALLSPLNKLCMFIDNDYYYPSLNQNDCINIQEIMSNKKILIINLGKGTLNKTGTELIGGVVLAKIKMETLKRSRVEKENRIPTIVLCDEVQTYATSEIEESITEGRKFGVAYMMAHQELKQAKGDLLKRAMGMVGNNFIFNCSTDDLLFFSKKTGLSPEKIKELNQREVYASLLVKGNKELFKFKTIDSKFIDESKKYKIINEVDNINLINRKNRFTILKELKNEY